MPTCNKCGHEGRTFTTFGGNGVICADCALGPAIRLSEKRLQDKRKIISQMQMTIYPTQQLEPGTVVQVINKGKAVVVSADVTTDQHHNPIVVHYLRYPSGIIKPCNYSFICQPI